MSRPFLYHYADALSRPQRHTIRHTKGTYKQRLWRSLSKSERLGALRVQRRHASCRHQRAIITKSDLRACNSHFQHGRVRGLLVAPTDGADQGTRKPCRYWSCL